MTSASPEKKRAAGILIITATSPREFLLLRHPDRWDLPKGHRDGNESDAETALRETEEETGLSADRIRLDPEFRFRLNYPVKYKRSGKAVEKTVTYFIGEVDQTFEPILTEHPEFRWFPWAPPHQIQDQTIDPLLQAVADYLEAKTSS
ncbi:bis(5'-nucleosyl)-tetraphosphatase [Roseiconus lacunae]|uniref:Bis(5'-nucleosyl)-tetraphosphatase [asymmetrical] n=1 Tax=Roseiconus lacunae TaxID=2605694 RepID=A0ABT7PRH1_9BACT|nr:NUDIX domain-containing protein [Roseiconus lacunae]MCD0458289.1 NUDIX domain-containing protein [Roseiconus lacunae]MDM4019102.1 NUDIX domain-containing protein [Roseiconus lacunae]